MTIATNFSNGRRTFFFLLHRFIVQVSDRCGYFDCSGEAIEANLRFTQSNAVERTRDY